MGGEGGAHDSGAGAPSSAGDYVIVKEGEAEILMRTNNEVFYNKTQVNNRDISIAVLRMFTSKRGEEHAAMISRKKKVDGELLQNGLTEPVGETSDLSQDVKVNCECKVRSESAASESGGKSDFSRCGSSRVH